MPVLTEHVPTDELREEVKTYAGLGTPQVQIAEAVGISKNTLRKYYAKELRLGKIKANALVAQGLFALTQDKTNRGHVAAIIFWLKTQAGWRTTDRLELTGPDGKPLAQQLDLSRLTDEEFAIFRPLYEKCLVAAPIRIGDDDGPEGGDEEAV